MYHSIPIDSIASNGESMVSPNTSVSFFHGAGRGASAEGVQRGKVLRVILALLSEDNSEEFSTELWDWWNMVCLPPSSFPPYRS